MRLSAEPSEWEKTVMANKSADIKTNIHNNKSAHAAVLYGNGYEADIGHLLFYGCNITHKYKKRG
ncbi:hypothetical protein C4H11_01325 [Bacteroides zoogleoformans]|uniref:Uncharacterized protein n=1 Tax=Bacteroides zoogleoformans TaxID=28119 RepID=A0ABM6T597_9BACE|nr:hypothetical protein C4H11_01325 [Bacteroides zoogleoformans]